MSTFGTMVTEIASELRRGGFTSEIKIAIAAAVDYHRSMRLPFNQLKFTFSTVASQEYYTTTDDTDIALIAKIDVMMLVDGSNEYEIIPKDSGWIDTRGMVSSGLRSFPENYAYIRSSIRLFPIPVSAKTIRVDGLLELIDDAQSASLKRITRSNITTIPDNYASAWFTDGYEQVKAWAKGYLYLHHFKNAAESSAMFTAGAGFASQKLSDGQASGGTDFVEPSAF